MSYRFKGPKIILNTEELCVTPKTLPSNPDDGCTMVDATDNKLKVWNGSRWIVLGDAVDISFDNSIAQLDGNPTNVQEAIEAVKGFRVQSLPFQLIGNLNFDNYLYAFKDAGGDRSGDTSNGYEFSNSAPLTSLYSGTVVSAAASIKGVAVSTGTPASSVNLLFELWRVGFNGEGTKLGDIEFNIDSSTYTVGQWWNSSVDTDFAENQAQNVDVSAGDLLGLKFIRQTGNSGVVEIKNATIVLEVEGNA